jgi:hypothetical protein
LCFSPPGLCPSGRIFLLRFFFFFAKQKKNADRIAFFFAKQKKRKSRAEKKVNDTKVKKQVLSMKKKA